MILRSDLSGDPTNGCVAKFIVEIERDGSGCYSLEFPDDVALTENLRKSFLPSRWVDEVDVFIGEALRHNAEFIPLPVPSDESIRFVQQNRERLGKHSRPLAA